MINIKNIILKVLELPRSKKELIVIFLDILISIISTWVSFFIILDLEIFIIQSNYKLLPFILSIFIFVPMFLLMNIYSSIFRYFDIRGLQRLSLSILIYGCLYFLIIFLFEFNSVPRSIGIVQPTVFFIIISTSRIFYMNIIFQVQNNQIQTKDILIYGAGSAGIQVEALVSKLSEYKVIGFIDDDEKKVGRRMLQKKIYSLDQIIERKETMNINEVFISISNIDNNKKRDLLFKLEELNCSIKILPNIVNLVDGKINFNDLRQVNVADLIERKVNIDQDLFDFNYINKNIIVTGAGGSIGSELCKQIIKFKPRKILLIDNSEYNLYNIEKQLVNISKNLLNNLIIVPTLLSINNRVDLEKIFIEFAPDYVFHAAAYKHVNLVEKNISESIRNNFFGTINVVDAFLKTKCKNFVLISSDKAVRPSSIMGASKRLAEVYVQSINDKHTNKILSIVRFGNVLDSSGSVIPLFREQINNGGPVTVTHPEVTRFFMTIPEAASLILQATNLSNGGEVFLLDMGKPIKILDLAKKMINLSGFEVRTDKNYNKNNVIEIQFTGLKQGEKLYEELLITSNNTKRLNNNILVANEDYLEYDKIEKKITLIKKLLSNNNINKLIEEIKEI